MIVAFEKHSKRRGQQVGQREAVIPAADGFRKNVCKSTPPAC